MVGSLGCSLFLFEVTDLLATSTSSDLSKMPSAILAQDVRNLALHDDILMPEATSSFLTNLCNVNLCD